MTNRAELRDLVVAALLSGQTLASQRVYSWRTFPTTKLDYPCLMVQAPSENKRSEGKNGPPNFTSLARIVVTGRVEGVDTKIAEGQMEQLGLEIERAVINDFELFKVIQEMPSVSIRQDISTEGGSFLGDVEVTFELEHYQSYQDFAPIAAEELHGADVHLDLAAPYDAAATYSAAVFPQSVTAAPRTSGPDGRDEAALSINLNQ